jgi:THO complex subunit 2
MQEQERIANEEAEKRLKAALTAKREPSSAPRLASPAPAGTSNAVIDTPNGAVVDTHTSAQENTLEDVAMDVDTTPTMVSPSAEVRSQSICSGCQ